MPYAILRFKKCKSGGVGAAYAHNERKKEAYKSNPDIDLDRKADNYHLVLPRQTYQREVKRLIQSAACRTRKDSTVMVETLITASPEFMQARPPQEQREFFTRALAFVESKVGKENIIAAVVHMDETTPHMHLSFCPITEGKNGKSLSAKALLGNQAQLSRWQSDYHAAMSERWTELERGISSMITGRKHIPKWLFSMAQRLDKQAAEIEQALEGINAFNAKKQRDNALNLLEKWLPQAERFTAQIKTIDEHIKALERAEKEAGKRAQEVEKTANRRIQSVQGNMQNRIDSKDNELLKARKKAYQLSEQLRKTEALMRKVPQDVLDKIREKKERGLSR
jgi:hypothetical protein